MNGIVKRSIKIASRIGEKTKEYFVPIIVRRNYNNVLCNLREKAKRGEKLKVIFYTNEPQKWSYESVYREFERSPFFDPCIIVVPRYRVHIGDDKTRMSLEEQYLFYKSRNYNVEYGYIDGQYIDIKSFHPDIFFYLQLAEIPGIDNPEIISRYALTAYCPYAFQLSNYKKEYLQNFHKLLFVYYVVHDLTIKRFESYKKGNSSNCISTGYPKLDVYHNRSICDIQLSNYWKDPQKIKIIYAPHHSFRKVKSNTFQFGTFPKNYQLILDLAKKTSDITTWIFKPHPMLRSVIVKERIMSEEETKKYYDEWAKIGNLYDTGDYFDIFISSDIMITDCASFLAEYLPSHKPLIRLINPKCIEFDEVGQRLSKCYYNAHNNEELLSLFKSIVLNKEDYLKNQRIKLANTLVNPNVSASHIIINNILNRLHLTTHH